jgi:sulfur-oxidizing protein SoxZ
MGASMKLRASVEAGVVTLKVMIRHPMESGSRKDERGRTVPAHFVKEVVVNHGARTVMTAHWGGGVARNPYFSIQFREGKAGDTVSVRWLDNLGSRDSASIVI